MNNKPYYFTREHRGTLIESLETIKEISRYEFIELEPKYQFYAYDERVKQLMFVAKDMQKTTPTWLGIGVDDGASIEEYINTHETK